MKPFGGLPAPIHMDHPGDHPAAAAWKEVLGDMQATAASYEEDGWQTLQIHPGDVTVRDGDVDRRIGLDILIPDNEFASVRNRLESGFALDDYEVFTAVDGGFVLLLLALRDHDRPEAVLVPAYYSAASRDTESMFASATDRGWINTYLRRLDGEYIEFTHEEPELFQPVETTG
mgnify:CR=1 FL=1